MAGDLQGKEIKKGGFLQKIEECFVGSILALQNAKESKMEVNLRTRLTHIGFGNYLSGDRIIAIAVPSSAPIKRSIQDAKDKEMVIDLTNGHRTKSIVFIDCKYVVLSALEPVTLSGRLAAEAK